MKHVIKYSIAVFTIVQLFVSCQKSSSSTDSNTSKPVVTVSLAKVNTLSASEISNFSAKVGGEVVNDGGGQITSRGICWSTFPGPTIDSTKTTEGSGNGSFISQLTSLKALTKYYFRAYATNSKGTSYGDEVSFTTIYINPIFLATNGYTIKCMDWAQIGDKGIIDGIEYTVVSATDLKNTIKSDADYSKFCTSKITDMSDIFSGKTAIRDITRFDVSNVTNMAGMFIGCSSFNQDISIWDVSKVTNMNNMFLNCYKFNQDIGKWNLSKVTTMDGMLTYCHQLNQDLSKWDVSNVTTMGGMFQGCRSFNGNVKTWNMSKVKNIRYMFNNCPEFNQDLSQWDVSNVTDMDATFAYCVKFNQDLSKWNVKNVINMLRAFDGASIYNQDLSKWDVVNVINCENFSRDTYKWTLPKPKFTKCN
jgi:surface protein